VKLPDLFSVTPEKVTHSKSRLGLAGVLVVASCGGGTGVGASVEVDSAGIKIITSASPSEEWVLEPEPELALGVRNGGPTEFYGVRAIAFLPGDRIAIANRGTDEIRFFTRYGEYLGAVGRTGSGPEEFRGLYWLVSLGDSLLTHDSGNDRVSVRDSFGRYGRTFRLEWDWGIVTPAAVLPDGTLAGITTRHMVEMPGTGLILDSALVSRYDLTGALVDSVGRFPHNQRVVRRVGGHQTTLGLPYSAMGRLVGTSDGFCYAFGVTPEVKCYDPNGRLLRIARLGFDPVPVTPADVQSYWERELASRNERYVQALRRMRDVMVFPDFFPAFADLRVDDRDRLWARVYAHPDAAQVEWVVFERGRWIARLIVDQAFALLAIEGERVIGVWRDELGVEFVRMHRLRRG
jgi:hypothetical protein